MINLV